MKYKKLTYIIVALFFGAVCVGFGWNQINSIEKTLVVLMCEGPRELTKKSSSNNYYKLTKRSFNEQPFKLYISNPNFDTKNSPPYLIGIALESAKESDKLILKARKYFPPDWYTFIPAQIDGEFIMPVATYVDRVKLKMEDWTLDAEEQWSSSNCSIVEESQFLEDWKSKVANKKKELKF
jgi:hypothetical protein